MNPVTVAVIVFVLLMVAFIFALCSVAHQTDEEMPGYTDYVAEEMRRD